jgi:ABC-2 type transport system ATP-binding protein
MTPPIEFVSATKTWSGQTALSGFDLTVSPGESVALLGRNGAGKSTAIGLALGLYAPDAGSIRVFGADARDIAARRRVGVMMQRADLPSTARVHEIIRLVCAYYPQPMSVEEAASAAGVEGLLRQRYGGLSGGQKRAVQFALSICGRPRLLILDEPAAALDAHARTGLWAAVRRMAADGCAVLLTSHHAEEVEALADRVCVLSGGVKAAEISATALLSSPAATHAIGERTAESGLHAAIKLFDHAVSL